MELTNDFAKDYPVQWDTEPITANALTFWRDWWNAKTWIKWHTALKNYLSTKYGPDTALKRANEVLLIHFSRAPFASPTTDFRSMDDEFIEYAKKNGFYDGLFVGLGGLVGKTAVLGTKVVKNTGKVIDTAGNVLDTAGDVVNFTGKYFKWIIAIVVILVIISAVYKVKSI